MANGDHIEVTESDQPSARPRLWRWILGTFIILISWLALGAILTAVFAGLFGLDLIALASTDKESLAIVRGYEPWQAATAV
ncbi:MAG: hypothetical protein RL464_828, partial [Actinomycetota bacterium]